MQVLCPRAVKLLIPNSGPYLVTGCTQHTYLLRNLATGYAFWENKTNNCPLRGFGSGDGPPGIGELLGSPPAAAQHAAGPAGDAAGAAQYATAAQHAATLAGDAAGAAQYAAGAGSGAAGAAQYAASTQGDPRLKSAERAALTVAEAAGTDREMRRASATN